MKHLFIDTNVFLSFYHLTSEDIEELKKLVALLDSNQIDLLLPVQVAKEFARNRASKIADAMKKFKETKFNVSFPLFSKDYREYSELRDLMKQADKKHSELIAKIMTDAESLSLNADNIVKSLFDKSTLVEISDDIYNAALKRVKLGNPPGKEGSLGDAVNWETVLSEISYGTDLYLVSEDKDYRSQLIEGAFSEFLEEEWREEKKSTIFFYSKISDFFKDNFPNIKIASEVAKDDLLQKLARSGSFSSTHALIAQLAKQDDFSSSQVEQLIKIAESNSQVGWIAGDPDVHEFYKSLQRKYGTKIQPDAAVSLEEIIAQGEPKHKDDDGIPF